jgi:hypothetical protein
MAWDTIQASEVDANSPLNQTLMDKIRQDLNYLAENLILFSGDDPVAEIIPGDSTWMWGSYQGGHKAGTIYVPNHAATLLVAIESKFENAGVTGRQIRVRVSDNASGWNYTDIAIPGDGEYDINFLVLPSSGVFNGTGGWRYYEIGHRQSSGSSEIAVTRNIVFKVNSIT